MGDREIKFHCTALYLLFPSVQVVCALASCRPIVTIAWLRDAVASCRDNKALPKPTKYMPTVVDEEVRKSDACFSPNFKRRTLFQDRVFYFFNQSQVHNVLLL